ncbi:hypothetical protein GTP29_18050 [Vibrio parahaemolyticus]|nr:hypothetical protein [Vibrio parahaemolyticus]
MKETAQEVTRMTFNSKHEFAAFAIRDDAPRYSACISEFYHEKHKVLGIVPGEVLFSNDQEALYKEAIGWERHQIKVSFVTSAEAIKTSPEIYQEWLECECPEYWWFVNTSQDFPEDLLEAVYTGDIGELLDQKVLESLFLERLCDLDGHPLFFFDKMNKCDKEYFAEVMADDAQNTPWDKPIKD